MESNDYLEYKRQEAIDKQTLETEAKICWQPYCSEVTDERKSNPV